MATFKLRIIFFWSCHAHANLAKDSLKIRSGLLPVDLKGLTQSKNQWTSPAHRHYQLKFTITCILCLINPLFIFSFKYTYTRQRQELKFMFTPLSLKGTYIFIV